MKENKKSYIGGDRIYIRVSKETKEELENLAIQNERSLSDMTRITIKKGLLVQKT